ncbi:tubulin domain-containing protein [Radiomyces spectabilis]|uniref:tubulin domain-containing protein n=1 Tax=Radiomyces spectabilis TaxID=64574 RepID=UPI002221161E|nr:tubulin domain-containing protein [Radiomyces spectabilis]KAI8374683.1 tubulin domain-containing protein [Radiomyces spectabilis]
METYTPRVLIYDLKGAFGSLQKYNKLFIGEANEADQVPWENGINAVATDVREKNRYQQELDRLDENTSNAMDLDVAAQMLDTTVTTWSDYNRIFYHPRSVNTIQTHTAENPLHPFNVYSAGRQAYDDNEKETDIFDDNFRFFAEECDQLQGFQLLTGIDDAFGGFAEGLLQDIRDEFPKLAILTYGISSNTPSSDRARQKKALSHAFSLARLSPLSSLYVPLRTPQRINSPYLHANCESLYHTSAILSAAIETASLPYRLKKNGLSLTDSIALLNRQQPTRLAGLTVSLPVPVQEQANKATLDPCLLDLTIQAPQQQMREDVTGEVVVLRGIPNSRMDYEDNIEQACSSFKHEHSPFHYRSVIDAPYPIAESFPRFFDSSIGADGLIESTKSLMPPHSVPALSRLYNGDRLGAVVEDMVQSLKGISFKDHFEYAEGDYGFGSEDYAEMKETLITLADGYRQDDGMM